jgi:hypothetical protein
MGKKRVGMRKKRWGGCGWGRTKEVGGDGGWVGGVCPVVTNLSKIPLTFQLCVFTDLVAFRSFRVQILAGS